MVEKDKKTAQQDERIAPQAPRGADGGIPSLESKPTKRKRVKYAAIGVVTCAVVLIACVFGLEASGVLPDSPQGPQLVAAQDAQESEASASAGAANSDTDSAADDKKAVGKSKKKGSASKEKSGSKKTSTGSKEATEANSSSKKSSSGKASSNSNSNSSSKTDAAKPSAAADSITVTLSIDGSRAGTMDTASRATSKIKLKKGASVYDALVATGVSIGGDSYYVSSINGLAEKQCGTYSGWMYSVNGEYPNKTCGDYKLHGSEKIIWVYTCDLGNDL